MHERCLLRCKILEFSAFGKCVISHEKVKVSESLDSVHENGVFFGKTEYFSKSKQPAISDEMYENLKYLFQTLKMENLLDMNDLYNFQDVSLLQRIVEKGEKAVKRYNSTSHQ